MKKKTNLIECRKDTEENWNKAKNYKPSFGTIVIYEFEDGSIGMKMGNGESLVGELPFVRTVYKPTLEDGNLVL